MPDPSSQFPPAVIALAIGLLALLCQAFFTLWLRSRAVRLIRFFYWMTVSCWVTAGIWTSTSGGSLGLGWVSDWLLPAAGLLTATLLQWRFEECPQLLLEEHSVGETGDDTGSGNSANGQSAHEELDAEDRQLLARLLELLGRRARHLMIPIESLPHVFEDDSMEQVLDMLRQHCLDGERLCVLGRDGRRVLGIIDGRNLIPRLHPPGTPTTGGEGPLEPTAAQTTEASESNAAAYCLPIPSIAGRDSAERAIEALRQGGRGAVAVYDPRGRVVGLIGWQGLFRLLTGRPVGEGHL